MPAQLNLSSAELAFSLSSTSRRGRYRLGFDIGGTFTDFVLIETDSGQITSYKTLTTPQDPSKAVIAGLQELLRNAQAAGDDIETAIHGTTLITNALIERKGAKTALITTKGFRDILEMAKEMRYDIYDLLMVLPEPLVPRLLRYEVAERVDGRGRVVEPLAVADLVALKPHLEESDIDAVAVCFLHSFTNPEHEQQAVAWLKNELPGVSVSVSSEVAPEIREYERMSTTVCNAYVQPLTERYLTRLQRDLVDSGFRKQLYLMLSSGGITTVETAAQFPVRLIESGPAAGVLAAVFYGEKTGVSNLVSFDMGGTTAKMCVIKDGRPIMSDDFEVARVHRFKRGSGLPVRVPTIELIEIGAGGGSIARVDELGLLKIGPESASADPGPACYGQGGAQPTVTDADLLLGYLNPEYFLGGRMSLDRAAAERAVQSKLAEPLGMSLIEAAYGIYQVVNQNMISATRVHVAERGADPRKFTLIAFGGAGPVHAHQIARELKMQGYICPAGAGVASALGFLTAPVAFEFARTHIAHLTQEKLEDLDVIYAELEREGRARLAEAGVPEEQMSFVRKADLRHIGQGHEIVVELPFDQLADVALDDVLRPLFYSEYEQIYGYAHRHLGVEITTCRLTASGLRPQINLEKAETAAESLSAAQAIKGERPVYFRELGGFVDTPVYDRYQLRAGMNFAGPAIVEERDSTAVIGPDADVHVDIYTNLLVTLKYE
ncbi:MAG: hydantoinase/oxoprolinase family protein [Caldilineaceae bacterium]|nr:hydantoinase/oxoprolinase family protein [Caldilineaceae bacterium]